MFRINNHLLHIRFILRRHRPEIQIPNIYQPHPVQYKMQIREPCPEKPPPPPPKPKDDSAFWGAMTIVFVAAGFAVIAKRSPEIRDWVTIRAPWFDDVIAVLYEENMTYKEFMRQCVEDVKIYLTGLMKEDDKPKSCSFSDSDVPVVPVSNKTETEDNKGVSIDPEKGCIDDPPPIAVTKTVCEIIERLKDRGDEVLSNYYTAAAACSLYNQVVAETMQNFSIPTLKEMRGHMIDRLNLVKESLKKAEEAIADIEELKEYFECGAKGSQEDIENTKVLMADYEQKIKTSFIQYQWENDKSVVLDQLWPKVENIIDKYAYENETMFQELKYDQNKLKMQGDPDLLLFHTSRYTQKLKEDLKDAVTAMSDRVNRAFGSLSQGAAEKKQRESMMYTVLQQMRAEMDKDYAKRYNDQKIANDNRLKESLKKQLERHQETMELRVKQKEVEATATLNKLVAEKVAFEKRMFAKQLSEMSVKLKLVEDKLNARLKAESETKRSQELWVAGASLLAATKKGEPYVNVEKELKAIEKASGNGDKLVDTVLKAIPPSVREKGLVPASVLREKYHEMEKVALNVALVEQEGAPLPVYFLSWLQSMMLFMKLSGIPTQEYENIPQVPSKDLDTFDLLQRARFWIERGNLAAAVRYVNSLQGASRAAASTWYEAARSHLETRQAAEAVLAHAVTLGLQYL